MAQRGAGRVVVFLGLVVSLAGCMGDKGVAPALRPAEATLGGVRVTPINAIMAVGETLSLTVAGRTLADAPVTSFDSVQYILQNPTDSLRVQLSTAGVVTAVTPSGTNPVLVEVIAFKDGIARADQAVVQVVATSFPGATLSIQSGGSQIQWGQSRTIVPVVSNTTGQSVTRPTLRYEYGPNDSTTMQCYAPRFVSTATLTEAQLEQTPCGVNKNAGQVGLNQIHAFKTGTAWVYATATVFGIVLRDSVQYTITNPMGAEIDARPYYLTANSPGSSDIYLAPGGTVTFYNAFPEALGVSVSFTFDDPSAASAADTPSDNGGASGNVTPLTVSQPQSDRKFLTPGVYGWTGTVLGGVPPYTGATWRGSIIVQ